MAAQTELPPGFSLGVFVSWGVGSSAAAAGSAAREGSQDGGAPDPGGHGPRGQRPELLPEIAGVRALRDNLEVIRLPDNPYYQGGRAGSFGRGRIERGRTGRQE